MPRADNSTPKTQLPELRNLVPALLSWFATNARDLPWRRTRDPYAIWVSEIMLQQTQVKTVLPYWQRWMRELPTIQSLAKAGPAKIHKLWEGLGYYTRVRNMQKAAILVLERHGGRFPETFDAILALPGIGRYTAGAICSIAFNQPTPILDGNVIRVLTRVFGIEKNPRERKTNAFLWHTAEELVAHASRITHQATRTRTRTRTKGATEPILGCSHLNQSLMELGALICTPRSPRCHLCPVKQLCVAFRQNRVEQLPSLGPRAAITERRFVAFIIERNGKFLVHQRPAGIVNAHLWEFPNAEVAAAVVRSSAFRRLLATRRANRLKAELRTFAPLRLPKNPRPFCTIKHSITRYRITLDAFYVQLGKSKSVKTKRPWRRGTPPAEFDGVWLKLPDLKKLSFPSAHKQIIAALADPG